MGNMKVKRGMPGGGGIYAGFHGHGERVYGEGGNGGVR